MTDRIASVAVLGLVVLSVLGPPAIAGHQGFDAPAQTTTPQDPAPPGERFQGALGIQVAEVEGEMEARRFDVGFEKSDSDAGKAALVAEQTAELESRLSELHQQRRAIQRARENGSISRGEYRARVAELSARTQTVERLANRTGQAARSLPEEALTEHGVEVAAIRELSANASELSGGEVAAIARSMAGDRAGRTLEASNRPSLPEPAPDERRESRPRDGTETESPTNRSEEPTPRDHSEADAEGEREAEAEKATTTEETATSTLTPTATPAEENSTEITPTPRPEDEDADTPREATATSTPTPDEETATEGTATSTPTPEETTVENRRSLRERIQGWLGSADYQPVAVARAQSAELRERPLLDVPVREDGSGRVTLVLVFDLTDDTAQRAFETMREDEAARADVRDRFRSRMASIAEQSATVTDRSMRVHDAKLNLNRSEDGETGVVRVSVAWEGLAAIEDGHLVVTEPFASGFTPDREFRVRITAPEQYTVTTTRPDPVEQDTSSVAWAKGTELDGFTLVFSPESRTPIPTERIEELQPERTISPANTQAPGFGAPVAILALLASVMAIRRQR